MASSKKTGKKKGQKKKKAKKGQKKKKAKKGGSKRTSPTTRAQSHALKLASAEPKRRTSAVTQGTLIDTSHSKDEQLNKLAHQYKDATGEYSSWGGKVRSTRDEIRARMKSLELDCYDDGELRVDLKHKDDGINVKLYDVEQ